MREWVSVENSPVKDGVYLTVVEVTPIEGEGKYSEMRVCMFNGDLNKWLPGTNQTIAKVTYWQKLPTFPKMDGYLNN